MATSSSGAPGASTTDSAARCTVDDLLGRCRFPVAGTEVTCAVSGGADSLSLLVLACSSGLRVDAVHVDHGLRPESGAEAEVVAAAAARFGATFRAETVVVEPGPNLEARARAARQSVLPAGHLTGHTADDQAETVILNLLRGAGIDGLAGIRDDGRHPLLALRRRETVALCAQLELVPVDDPTNRDPAFRRNRVRHEVLPLLDGVAARDVAAVIARQAAIVAAEADLLDSLAAEIDPTDARGLAGAPAALARRAVRRWVGGDHPPDAASVERILAVARGEILACEIAGGIRVARSAGRLRLEAHDRPG